MPIGDGVSRWFADILATDTVEAGYIAGGILMAALIAIGMIFSIRSRGGLMGLSILALFGSILCWFMGWFPPVVPVMFTALLMFMVIFERNSPPSE